MGVGGDGFYIEAGEQAETSKGDRVLLFIPMRKGKAAVWATWVVGFSVAGCGVRSSIFEVDEDAPTSQPEPMARPKPTTRPRPMPVPEIPKVPEPEPEPCQQGMCPDDGDVCNGEERCDVASNRCIHVAPLKCDDGAFCNGIETCDARLGCVPGDPMVCGGNSRCDEGMVACVCDAPYLPPECVVKTAYFTEFGQVRQLHDDGSTLWVATSNGLFAVDYGRTPHQVQDDAWTSFEQVSGFDVQGGMAFALGGAKWFAASFTQPLLRLDDGNTPLDQEDDAWTVYQYQRALTPRGIAVDRSGSVWLGNFGETLVFSDAETPRNRADDTWRTVSDLGAPDELARLTNVDALLMESGEVVWLGSSSGGLFRYDVASESFSAPLGVEVPVAVLGLSSSEESLWLARRDTDVAETTLSTLSEGGVLGPQHRAESVVSGLDVDLGGHVWFTALDGSLGCLEAPLGNSPGVLNSDVNQGLDPARTVLTRTANDLWMGTDDGVVHLEHGGSCAQDGIDTETLWFEQILRSSARDVETEGDGVWFATDRGVDYLDTRGTPFDKSDDRWAHFDSGDVEGLSGLQGVVVREDGIKFFWSQDRVFSLDDGGTRWDKADDAWVAHDAQTSLWVSGVVDTGGRLLVVGRSRFNEESQPRIVVFEPGDTPRDPSDDVVAIVNSGLMGMGRSMAIDTSGHIWLGTETQGAAGNLYHWDPNDTPLDGSDDSWTPVRKEDGRVWKLVSDPTGGIWGTAGGGVFHFFDNGTPTELTDDYWASYPTLGSAMDIGENGNGWFRISGGAAILDVGGTARDPDDDVERSLAAPDALRFQSDLYTNGTVDEDGRFWIADERAQVFEAPPASEND